jgi:hypothetical protein
MQVVLEVGTAVLGIVLALPIGWAALDGVLSLAFGRITPISLPSDATSPAPGVPVPGRGE